MTAIRPRSSPRWPPPPRAGGPRPRGVPRSRCPDDDAVPVEEQGARPGGMGRRCRKGVERAHGAPRPPDRMRATRPVVLNAGSARSVRRAPMRLDLATPHHVVQGVIGPLEQDVGPDRRDHRQGGGARRRRRGRSPHRGRRASPRGPHVQDRARRTFQGADRGIAVDRHDQAIHPARARASRATCPDGGDRRACVRQPDGQSAPPSRRGPARRGRRNPRSACARAGPRPRGGRRSPAGSGPPCRAFPPRPPPPHWPSAPRGRSWRPRSRPPPASTGWCRPAPDTSAPRGRGPAGAGSCAPPCTRWTPKPWPLDQDVGDPVRCDNSPAAPRPPRPPAARSARGPRRARPIRRESASRPDSVRNRCLRIDEDDHAARPRRLDQIPDHAL